MARQPHHNPDAERAVIGAALIDPSYVLPEVAHLLTPETYYAEAHRAIWRAILKVRDRSGADAVDAVTVSAQLQVDGSLDLVGGGPALLRLATDCPTSVNVVSYAEVVARDAQRRSALAVVRQVGIGLAEGTIDPDAARMDLSKAWPQALTGGSNATMVDVMRRSLAQKEALAQTPVHERLVLSAFTSMRRFGQYRTGQFVVIGARPSMGKTSLLIGEALAAARTGVPVYLASLESSAESLSDRMLAAISGVDSMRIALADMSAGEWERVLKAAQTLSALPLRIDDRTATIDELCQRVRADHAHYGTRLVCVDYLQLIRPPSGLGSRATMVDAMREVSMRLAALRKELPIVLMAAAQVNRGGSGRRPTQSDIKESGQIEQDADMIAFPYRPHADGDADADPEQAELIVAKNRDGITGTIPLRWDGSRVRYVEEAPQESIAADLDSDYPH